MGTKRLGIYLNDHLATAVAFSELAGRVRGSNEGPLSELLAEVEEALRADVSLIEDVMGRLGVRVNPVKRTAGWVAEKLGRLKLNGQLTGYSDLSRVIELEGLVTGLRSNAFVWKSLGAVANEHPELNGLDTAGSAEHDESLATRVIEHQRAAVELAFGS